VQRLPVADQPAAGRALFAAIYDEHAGLQDRFLNTGVVTPERAMNLGLTGGEDYVLLFTARPRHRRALLELGAFEIGTISQREGVRLDGKTISRSGGFQHR
jgi:thiamine monophosphate kinase